MLVPIGRFRSTYSTFPCCHRKSSSSKNRLSLNETKQGQEELVDHNVLLSEMLREIRTCDMVLALQKGDPLNLA